LADIPQAFERFLLDFQVVVSNYIYFSSSITPRYSIM